MSEYQHPLPLEQASDEQVEAVNKNTQIEPIKEPKEPIDWQLVTQIAGMVIAVSSFIFGAISNLFDSAQLPAFSQVIYTGTGAACLLAMWVFWINNSQKLFWLAIAATFLIMYGA